MKKTKLIILIITLIFSYNLSFAQDDDEFDIPPPQEAELPVLKNEVFEEFAVTQRAKFIGGHAALMKFISKNTRYPREAIDSNISGRVILQFTVNKDSTIGDIKVMGNRRLGYGLEEEAIRVLKMTSGKWVPGSQRGEYVRMRMRLPFKFNLY